ncbi:MAG: bifunctional folylpolyglutamate synthase/dihydrofolate synthase [Treponema sp.]|jgi:dihydrofolate synthase/folylpolyglutamate synthase|nr:bifunctional folylpolyglutamate synthase/dihydrofolate synthase [Treponema sp.]
MNVEYSAPFTGSSQVFDWLSRFINIDRGQSVKSFRLDRTEMLCEMAGHPERSSPSIHVAGSKGKGSVTGMISAILAERGLRVARYTSPHVSEYRERITLGNDFLDESVYAAAGEELRGIVDSLKDPAKPGYALFNGSIEDGEEPAFFELLTLYFFLCARRAKCDVMVVETGIGGRLDSTNVVDPLVSVITSIELEHTEFLGGTIEAIAREKAGIIKRGRPLVLLDQDTEAFEIFKKAVEEKNSPFIYLPEAARIDSLRYDRDGTSFSLRFEQGGRPGEPLELFIPIPGAIQGKNASLAILAAKAAFPDTDAGTIKRALAGFTLPARFERIRDNPPVIIDGAHTPKSTAYCIETFGSLYGKAGILLFGCAAHKDAYTMAQTLAPQFSRIVITTPGNFKVSYPEQIYDIFKGIIDGGDFGASGAFIGGGVGKPELIFIRDTDTAIEKALALGKETGLPVLGIGSFYLVAEIRNRTLP